MSDASHFIIENGILKNYMGPGEDVVIPKVVTRIAHGAFSSCSGLTGIVLPKSVTSIGDWAFQGCSALTEVVLHRNGVSIAPSAFDGCPLSKAPRRLPKPHGFR